MHPANDYGNRRAVPAFRDSWGWQTLWQAVVRRQRSFDGAFVYAVQSTGVYCRPSCPARRPRRAQVLFFASPEAAEQQGFRACLRCRPKESPHNEQLELVAGICRFIEANTDAPARLAALAKESGVHPLRLQRLFVQILGISPRSYGEAIRVRRLKTRLQRGDNVTTALYEAGYGSSSRLYEGARRQLGMTPATYRRGGHGMEIGYTTARCRLGRLLVAGTTRGISAVYLGDADAGLETALRREYPQAQIYRNSAKVSRWVRQIVRHLSGRQEEIQLPLDIAATAFQRRVWEALLRIPYGETRTYSEIAKAIGRPKAARAVARACATNPVSVVIPCHRVVRRQAGSGGYRWGIERKQALQEMERKGNKQPGRKAAEAGRETKRGRKQVTPAA